MHSTPFFDLAGRIPPDVGQQLGVPRFRAHAAHAASGIAAFSMHDDLPEPLDLSGCDSETRLHFSLWVRGDIEAQSAVSTLHAHAGQAVNALLPGVPWRIRYRAGPLHNVGLLLSPDTLLEVAGGAGHAYLERLEGRNRLDVMACGAQVLRTARELDAVLFDETSMPLLREAKMLELLARLLQAGMPGHGAEVPPSHRRRLAKARELLLADPARAPAIAELARACGINSCSLKRDFKALYGTSIHALHQQERMALAWRLIEAGERSVSEAGEQVGYSSLGHFSAAFRKAFGLLPSELRRRACVAVDVSPGHETRPPQKS